MIFACIISYLWICYGAESWYGLSSFHSADRFAYTRALLVRIKVIWNECLSIGNGYIIDMYIAILSMGISRKGRLSSRCTSDPVGLQSDRLASVRVIGDRALATPLRGWRGR
jgi:hypothetical protein